MVGLGRGAVEWESGRVEDLNPNQAAFLAEGAEVGEFAGELVKEGLPIGGRGGQQQRGGIEVEELAAAGDFVVGVAVGQPAEVADADKAGRQDVEEEAAEELDGVEGEHFFPTAVTVILPAEPDTAVFDLQEAVVGECDAVSVASEVLNDLGGAAEWALGIDDPALTAGRTQPAVEGFWIGERGQIAKETELSLLKGQPQCVLEQMAEASAENFDREEEVLAMFLRATAAIQCWPSGERPPPGTTQCRCG